MPLLNLVPSRYAREPCWLKMMRILAHVDSAALEEVDPEGITQQAILKDRVLLKEGNSELLWELYIYGMLKILGRKLEGMLWSSC